MVLNIIKFLDARATKLLSQVYFGAPHESEKEDPVTQGRSGVSGAGLAAVGIHGARRVRLMALVAVCSL